MITTLEDAIAKLKLLPVLAGSISAVPDDQLINILQITRGRTVSGIDVFRLYAAAAMLINLNSELWLIKRHDRTELNSPAEIIKSLADLQAMEDQVNGVIAVAKVPVKNAALAGIVSYLPRVVG